MATYLITGCAGFIGSRVTRFLLDDGHEVVGIDSINDAYDIRLKEWRLAQLCDRRGFVFHRADIRSPAALRGVVQGRVISAVINLAARAGVRYSVENPWTYYDTNVVGTLNLLELCREAEIGKLILASSSSVYGDSPAMPYREDQDTNRPLSPYAASKKAAEELCYSYHHLHDIDITVFRYFTVYGPAGRPDMLPFRLVQWISEGRPVTIYGDGKQSRDFTYVDDIARGTVVGLKHIGYQVVNLGSDRPVLLRDFVRLVEELLGKQAVIRQQERHAADVAATWADIGKADQLFGWRPSCSLMAGLEDLVRWYHDNRSWAKDLATL